MRIAERFTVLAVCWLTFVGCGGNTGGSPVDGGSPSGGRAGTGGAAAGGGGNSEGGRAGMGGSAGSGGATGGSAGTGGAATGGNGPGDSGLVDSGLADTGPDAPPGPFVTRAKQPGATKVDLLFMIDNSSSMADKQAVLSEAVPELVSRLIEAKCIDPVSGRVVGDAVNGVCTSGQLEFEPVKDLHIGIVSSSLGAHGAPSPVCDDAADMQSMRLDPHNNDRGHLISRGEHGPVPTFNGKGFLYYSPAQPGGLTTPAAVVTPFVSMVKGVGQHGCGYEAQLEAVYRFLIDPDPYDTIRIDTTVGGFGQAILSGTDSALLQQRADFLRPDSLVSVVVVSDENDCSVIDGGQGFYAIIPPLSGTGRSLLQHGTAVCLTNPNDKCCYNCGQTSPPPGCPGTNGDPECAKGQLTVGEDAVNLRCFNQKQRYGLDFLYPVQRYVDGFTKPMVPNRRGEMVANPLYAGGQRDRQLVFVSAITGVPWQNIAVDRADLGKGFKTARQLFDEGIWAEIVGDPLHPNGPIKPTDPHMIESITPRAGLPGPASAPLADPVHGHEWDPTKDIAVPNADLQYACTFELNPPRTCAAGIDCDCFGTAMALSDMKNPLCQDLTNGSYTNVQTRAKAYPATRILQVIQGLDPNQATLTSICPANTRTQGDDYGYRPAIHAILSRVRNGLRSRCFSPSLAVDPQSKKVPCTVIEAFSAAQCLCDSEPARRTAPPTLLTPEMLAAGGNCFCEIAQAEGNAQVACFNDPNPPLGTGDGWCYVDPEQTDVQACVVVQQCPAEAKRLIRFMSPNSEPRPGAIAFLRCDPGTPQPPPTQTSCR